MKSKIFLFALSMFFFTGISFAQSVEVPLVPITSWPVGNATLYTLQPTLSWYLNANGTGLTYEVQCVKASDPWPADGVVALASGMSYNYTSDLVAGTQYAWHVRSVLGTQKSAWSATALFSINAVNSSVPIIPITSWPVGNATIYTLQPALYWYLNAGGTGLTYEVQCVKASDPWPADGVVAPAPGMSYNYTSDLVAGTQYAWHVRSVLGTQKSAWSATALFSTNAVNSSVPIIPITSWPVGTATVYTLQPTLSWYLNANATGLTYEVQCIKNSDASWPADNIFATAAGLNYPIPSNLDAGTQYAWHVRSVLGTQKSAWSATALFTTYAVSSGPIVPITSWPVGTATVYTLQPTLSWYLNANATGLTYEVQCIKNSDASWPADNIFATAAGLNYPIPSNLDAGTLYAWRVRSVLGAQKSDWSTTALFSTNAVNSNGPILPITSWPVGNATEYTLQPALSWYLNANGTGLTYEVQCVKASDPWPADGVVALASGMSYNYTSDLVAGTQYAWRVRSVLGAQKSDWSTTALFTTFSTNGSVTAPLAGSPVNGVNISSNSVSLSWYLTTAPASAQTYRIEVSRNPDMSSPFLEYNDITQLDKIINPPTDGNYYWRVIAKTTNGQNSGYSNQGSFHIIGTTGVKDESNIIPAKFEVFQNYPNPFNPSTIIKYGLPNASNVTIKVFDMLGREVKTLVNEQKNAGTFSVQWNGDNNAGHKVTSGIYLFRVAAGTNIATKKMILLK